MIPQAIPERTWHQGKQGTAAIVRPAADNVGCQFADRCPAVMNRCRENSPPVYQTDPHRGVTCFLHEETSTIAPEGIEKLFVK